MNRLRNVLLRRCKSLSLSGSRNRPSSSLFSSSYSNLRSMSARDDIIAAAAADDDEDAAASSFGVAGDGADDETVVVFVGSSRRRYVISAEQLGHPLIAALIDGGGTGDSNKAAAPVVVAVRCEVVLFDHLLWMLDNAAGAEDNEDAVRELAQLYAC